MPFVADAPVFEAPLTDPSALAAVAADTLRYVREAGGKDPHAPDAAVVDTLSLVVSAGDALRDPAFLARCFSARRWIPDTRRWGGDLRLTRYLVYEVDGRTSPDAAHAHALWASPADELRLRYTRQDVAAGVYREGGEAAGRATPLVWLAHHDHEQAILQGTTAVRLPDGVRLFNVDRDNGIPYDRTVTDTTKQRRYWYFRETDAVRGWGVPGVPKIRLEPEVAVAGDLENVGLGRLLALRTRDGLRLVVLADTGGAFQPNLHQLDLYTGVFPSAKAFHAATSAIGDTATAWVLERKEGC
ncbi:MAG: hypothetical protein ACOZNI_09255 [Myxococcota bacterium]